VQFVARRLRGVCALGIVRACSTSAEDATMNASLRRCHGLLAMALCFVMPMAAQAATVGSGHGAAETRSISGIAGIALRGSIDLVVRQGDQEAVTVRADDNIIPLVQTTLESSGDGRTLRIQLKPGETVRSAQKIEVTVDLIRLTALSSSGSGDIRVGVLKTPSLSLSISGSSDARLEGLDTERFDVSISGSGDVQARGRASRFEISIAGSGDVRARELNADEVHVSIAGSGDAKVTAQKSLSVSIAGSGDVEYGGGATLASSRVAGSGSVRQRP
jgi:hypothetical protein